MVERLRDGTLLIENLSDVGKIKVEQVRTAIEPDLVYPLLRGRDISRWHAEPSAHIILAQDPEAGKGISESEMKKSCPKSYGYLKKFEGSKEKLTRGTLRGRALYKQYFRQSDPFYSMYNVGPYTMAPWKVAWRDMGSGIQVAVVGKKNTRMMCPEHHVMFVALESADEAHYLCAVLMSSPVQLLVSGYTTTTGMSTHVLEHVAAPKYRVADPIHDALARLSEKCHAAAIRKDSERLESLQNEVDGTASRLWGITSHQLGFIQEALAEARDSGSRGVEEEASE